MLFNDDTPFAEALHARTELSPCTFGRSVDLIDGIVTLGCLSNCWDLLHSATLLDLSILGFTIHPRKLSPRDGIVSMSEFLVEGSPSENKIVLS